jgi:hypothetical protein
MATTFTSLQFNRLVSRVTVLSPQHMVLLLKLHVSHKRAQLTPLDSHQQTLVASAVAEITRLESLLKYRDGVVLHPYWHVLTFVSVATHVDNSHAELAHCLKRS